jgi:hypothetical protein
MERCCMCVSHLLLDGVAVLVIVGGVDDLVGEALRDGLKVAEGVVAGLEKRWSVSRLGRDVSRGLCHKKLLFLATRPSLSNQPQSCTHALSSSMPIHSPLTPYNTQTLPSY